MNIEEITLQAISEIIHYKYVCPNCFEENTIPNNELNSKYDEDNIGMEIECCKCKQKVQIKEIEY